jgi:predicted nucleic acid-binding protein
LTLIDSHVLIDILGGDPQWSAASVAALADRAERGPIAVNDVIYAELSAGFDRQDELDREIETIGLSVERLSKGALFLAGQAFRRYRASGGTRVNVLADFFIGAQAIVERWPILTRDARRYRTYFPDAEILSVRGQ